MRVWSVALFIGTLHAQTPPAPQDPYNRLTPQSSVISFLELCRSGNFDRAARYLSLEKLPRDRQLTDGPQLARQLGRVLDRDAQFDVASLSRSPEGDDEDGLPPNRERVGSYEVGGKPLEVQLERIGPRAGLSLWVFSPDTVEIIPKLAQAASDSPIEKFLPPPLVNWTLIGTPLWRWIALVLFAVTAAVAARGLSRLTLLLAGPVCRRIAPSANCGSFQILSGPLQLIFAVTIFRAVMELASPSAIVRLYIARGLVLLWLSGIAWMLIEVVNLIVGRMRTALSTRRNTFSRSALPLGSRAVKAAILVFTITAILANWGYNTTAIVAGLGIGGIAVALAAQKTIENLFGGVAVISDRPVTVGDLIKFGDRLGTVDDIGLRSTRLRTHDRTVVTVPNAEFAAMVLENFAGRDKIWFHPKFHLRRDATPDQIRAVLKSVMRVLKENPKVEAGDLAVRFIGAGEYSLDIEVFAYVLTANNDEFLAIQQELLLGIMDAIAASGSALALPTQASASYERPAPAEPAPQRPPREDPGAWTRH